MISLSRSRRFYLYLVECIFVFIKCSFIVTKIEEIRGKSIGEGFRRPLERKLDT